MNKLKLLMLLLVIIVFVSCEKKQSKNDEIFNEFYVKNNVENKRSNSSKLNKDTSVKKELENNNIEKKKVSTKILSKNKKEVPSSKDKNSNSREYKELSEKKKYKNIKKKVVKKNKQKEKISLQDKLIFVKEVYGAIKYTDKFYKKEEFSDDEDGPNSTIILTKNGELRLYSSGAGDGGPYYNDEYYFFKRELVFCYKVEGRPSGVKDDGGYTYSEKQNRYYFYDGKMIQWKSSENGIIDVNSKKFKDAESEFKSMTKSLLSNNKPKAKSNSLKRALIDIKEFYGAINYAQKFYTVKKGYWAPSEGGDVMPDGDLTAYYNNISGIRKLVYKNDVLAQEYYYWDNSLVFILSSSKYGGKKHKDRYYFSEKGLIKWINDKGVSIIDEETLQMEAYRVIRNSFNFRRMFELESDF